MFSSAAVLPTIAPSIGAQLVSVPEEVPILSALEGLHSVLGGLQLNELTSTADLTWTGTFSLTQVILSVNGTFNAQPLSLNYVGGLANGTFGATDLTWASNWTGSLGGSPVAALDDATWVFDGTGYSLEFMQTGQFGVDPIAAFGSVTPQFGVRTFFRWLVLGLEVFAELQVKDPITGAILGYVIDEASEKINTWIGPDPPTKPKEPTTETSSTSWHKGVLGGTPATSCPGLGTKDEVATNYITSSRFEINCPSITGKTTVTATPEPSTFAFVGGGLTLLGICFRTHRRKGTDGTTMVENAAVAQSQPKLPWWRPTPRRTYSATLAELAHRAGPPGHDGAALQGARDADYAQGHRIVRAETG